MTITMKSKCKSLFSAFERVAFLPFGEVFDLNKGEVEKVFINTKDAHYIVSNNQVICTIDTFLKIRYKSGKSETIDVYKSKGVSKCAPDDKFNLLTGIKLATARAENDYNTYYSKLFAKYINNLSSFKEALDYVQENCEMQLIHNKQLFIPSLIDKKAE